MSMLGTALLQACLRESKTLRPPRNDSQMPASNYHQSTGNHVQICCSGSLPNLI